MIFLTKKGREAASEWFLSNVKDRKSYGLNDHSELYDLWEAVEKASEGESYFAIPAEHSKLNKMVCFIPCEGDFEDLNGKEINGLFKQAVAL